MTSKATRRARKRARSISLAHGESVSQVAETGRPRKDAPDAQREALSARLRVSGMAEAKTHKDAVAPAFGDDIGLCIIAMEIGPQKTADLWAIYCRMAAARRLYRMRYLGTTGDPQNAAIAMQSDAMQVDPDLRVDMRSPEERNAACKRAEAYWNSQLDKIAIPQWRMALRSAVDGFNGPFWRDGKPTQAGKWAAEGLRIIALDEKPQPVQTA